MAACRSRTSPVRSRSPADRATRSRSRRSSARGAAEASWRRSEASSTNGPDTWTCAPHTSGTASIATGATTQSRTVSGDVVLTNVTCDRLGVKSVSGNIEYSGTLARNGRYDVNTHSGTVRLTLSGSTGFELTGTTFSGSIRSELPLTIGGERERDTGIRRRGARNRSIRATFGDGSAALTLRTFSGDIIIAKR